MDDEHEYGVDNGGGEGACGDELDDDYDLYDDVNAGGVVTTGENAGLSGGGWEDDSSKFTPPAPVPPSPAPQAKEQELQVPKQEPDQTPAKQELVGESPRRQSGDEDGAPTGTPKWSSPSPSSKNTCTSLFITELEWWTTDAQIEEALAEFGRLKSIRFFEDRASGKSKGYCQVDFVDPGAAQACKETMNGRDFNGRPCIVSYATPQSIKQMNVKSGGGGGPPNLSPQYGHPSSSMAGGPSGGGGGKKQQQGGSGGGSGRGGNPESGRGYKSGGGRGPGRGRGRGGDFGQGGPPLMGYDPSFVPPMRPYFMPRGPGYIPYPGVPHVNPAAFFGGRGGGIAGADPYGMNWSGGDEAGGGFPGGYEDDNGEYPLEGVAEGGAAPGGGNKSHEGGGGRKRRRDDWEGRDRDRDHRDRDRDRDRDREKDRERDREREHRDRDRDRERSSHHREKDYKDRERPTGWDRKEDEDYNKKRRHSRVE